MLDCIDLLSDSEDEGCSSFAGMVRGSTEQHKLIILPGSHLFVIDWILV